MIEETDISANKNLKSKKFLTENIQEIWDSIKRPNLRKIGIEEEDSQLQGPENIFNRIIEENFPNLNTQDAYRTPSRLVHY